MTATVTKTKAAAQSAEWLDRALTIADRDDLRATLERVEYASYDVDGWGHGCVEVYRVPSRGRAGASHLVRHDVAAGTVTCDARTCQAAAYGLPCGHVGAAIYHIALFEQNTLTWRRAAGFAAPESTTQDDELPPAA